MNANQKRKNRQLIRQGIQSRRTLKARRRFKRYRNKRNSQNNSIRAVNKQLAHIKRRYSRVSQAVVPANFSFLEKPNHVAEFISQLKSHFADREEVFIEMKNVKLIDYSAIVVLLSIMVKFKTEKIKFNGDFPKDPIANRIFFESGFFQILSINLIKDREKFDFGSPNSIYTHASKNVDPTLGPQLMENVSKHLIGETAIYKGLQRTIIELMQNSFNHAQPHNEGEKHWWLSVNINYTKKVASFSFIDYGVGIFESLNSKDESSKWFNWKSLFAKFNTQSNAEILKLILDGELHKTVTGQDFRGKGLPGIKEAMDRNLISKLYIVTNDVYANVSENIYLPLSHNFEGTFVYWEINELTVSHPWNL